MAAQELALRERGSAGESRGNRGNARLVEKVRDLIAEHGLTPLEAPPAIRPELVSLGRSLFHDKILSGSRDVACGTCHNAGLGTADARPLSSGVGGHGIGLDRDGGQVIGRHSQPLFNLHTLEKIAIDGKVEQAPDGSVLALGLPAILPQYQAAFEDFPGAIAPRVIAGQALLPQVTMGEQLGFPGPGADPDNELLECMDPAVPLPLINACIFDKYMVRLGQIPEYVAMFEAAYGAPFEELNFGHVGNAIAAYELTAFISNDSPWDQFVAGDDRALTNQQLAGASVFLDEKKGNCVGCHSGNAFTDNQFHQTLAPTFGCGNDLPKRNGPAGMDDFGRARNVYAFPWVLGGAGDEIFPEEERYMWRTAPLRNLEFTAPYGRTGQHATLEAHIAHYKAPVAALEEYDITQLPNVRLDDQSPFGCEHESLHESLLDNVDDVLRAGVDPRLWEVHLDDGDVESVAAFLRSLSSSQASPAVLGATIPSAVPSGLTPDAPRRP